MSDALIHLRVPAATKARWVRQSRAAGMRLTDWIVEQLERPMKTYPIPDAIASQYRGAGYALAASAGGQLVALRYLADLAPELDAPLSEGGAVARQVAQGWIVSDAAGPTVRELQALGDVHVGMCSAWEFCEL